MRLLSMAAALMALTAVVAQAPAAAPPSTVNSDNTVQVLQVRPDFYMLTVEDVNVGLEIGPEGAVVVDSGPASATGALLREIGQLSKQPIRFVIDTSADPTLIGGNEMLSAAGLSPMIGWTVETGSLVGRQAADITGHLLDTRAPIIARQGVLDQLVSEQPAVPLLALPSEVFSREQYNFRLNGDIVNVVRMPPAHSDADSVVRFQRADVVVTGAIFDIRHFPVLDLAHGGSIDGEIAAIDQVMNTLVVPSGPVMADDDGTLVIPLHGQVCSQPDLLIYRDMLYAVRNRVQALISQGDNLAQIEAADPTQGYARRFSSVADPKTTQDFVATVYRSLKMTQAQERGRGYR